MTAKALLILCLPVALASHGLASPALIAPGSVWLDDRGQPIQAHGGGITEAGGTYYWFGEDRSKDNLPSQRCVSCYSSEDLAHWKFCGQALRITDPEGFGPKWILERPKVFANPRTGKFVMYMHIDGPVAGMEGDYRLARVGVAVSDRIDGPYRYVRSFRPLGMESRDIGQFVDDDGSAYLIFESRPTRSFVIARLSGDYLGVDSKVCQVDASLEGGAIVHYQGLYYAIGSHLTGWDPNPNVYATSRSLAGPWGEFRDIAPPGTKTYGSQSSFLLKVSGSRTTTVIFMGDIWKPQAQWDSRYLWMPVVIGDGRLSLPKPGPWSIDVETGQAAIENSFAGLPPLSGFTIKFTRPGGGMDDDLDRAPWQSYSQLRIGDIGWPSR
ncbi:MAG TPA: family 43 glycosylhydrolase [Opitutaceae bacterium]|jgi:hypothetical protein